MRGTHSTRATLSAIAAVFLVISFAPQGKARAANSAQSDAAQAGCDRACLDGFLDQYLAALVAKDPARLPWAARGGRRALDLHLFRPNILRRIVT